MAGLRKFYIMAALLAGILAGACKNEEIGRIYLLTFGEEAYETRAGVTTNVPFRSGNKDYMAVSSDTAVVKVSVSTADNIGFGTLQLHGKREGKAVVSVTDNVSGETVRLQVTVTHFYLSFQVVQTDSVIFQKGDLCFFILNDTSDFLVYDGNEPELKYKGNYEFALTGDKPLVHVEYKAGEQAAEHTFDMTGSSAEIFSLLGHYLRPEPAAKTRDVMHYYFMNLEEVVTGGKVVCVLRDMPLPKE